MMSWRHDRNWVPEIGAPFLPLHQVQRYQKIVATLPKRRLNSTLATIGTASYIDLPEHHQQTAIENNLLLTTNLPGLHRHLLEHLNERYQKDLYPKEQPGDAVPRWVYPPKRYQIALPGIHLFAGNSLLGKGYPVASVHVDKQEERCPLPLAEYSFDFSRTYSFTIPLTTPKGTGLYIIDVKEDEVSKWVPLWWSLRGKTMQRIDYQLGQCYLHHGKYFHCIAPFWGKQNDGRYLDRITIQGHAVYCRSRNEYWVYW